MTIIEITQITANNDDDNNQQQQQLLEEDDHLGVIVNTDSLSGNNDIEQALPESTPGVVNTNATRSSNNHSSNDNGVLSYCTKPISSCCSSIRNRLCCCCLDNDTSNSSNSYSSRTVSTVILIIMVLIALTLYFTLPWVDVVENVLNSVEKYGYVKGQAFLFGVLTTSLVIIFGPNNPIELGWGFIYGWVAAPIIISSYAISIFFMLGVGNLCLCNGASRLVRWSNTNHLIKAIKDVIKHKPYVWFFVFQFWSIMKWQILIYCAPLLLTDNNNYSLMMLGCIILLGQIPMILYTCYIANSISNLDTLVSGQFDSLVETIVLWCSLILTIVISVLLYWKIRNAYYEAILIATATNANNAMNNNNNNRFMMNRESDVSTIGTEEEEELEQNELQEEEQDNNNNANNNNNNNNTSTIRTTTTITSPSSSRVSDDI